MRHLTGGTFPHLTGTTFVAGATGPPLRFAAALWLFVLCGSSLATLLGLGVLRQLVAAALLARGALRHVSGSCLALRALRQLSGNSSNS